MFTPLFLLNLRNPRTRGLSFYPNLKQGKNSRIWVDGSRYYSFLRVDGEEEVADHGSRRFQNLKFRPNFSCFLAVFRCKKLNLIGFLLFEALLEALKWSLEYISDNFRCFLTFKTP